MGLDNRSPATGARPVRRAAASDLPERAAGAAVATCDDDRVSDATVRASDPWDRVAAVYRAQEPLERRSIHALLADVDPRPDERVLDLGSGLGTVSRRLTRGDSTREVLAVERSTAMVARGRFGTAALVRAEGQLLPLAGDSIDVLLAAWVLHVLPRSVRRQAVAEAARVLRPTGRLGLVVPARPMTAVQRLIRRAATAGTASSGLGTLDVPVGLEEDLAAVGLRTVRRRRTGVGYLADVVVCLPGAPVPGVDGHRSF